MLGLFFGLSTQAQTGLENENVLGRLFLEAFQKQDFKKLKTVFVPVELYPKIAPEEAKGKSKAELNQLKKVVEKRLKSKWAILKEEADFYKISRNQLKFQETALQEIPTAQGGLYGLDVISQYGSKSQTFTLIITQHAQHWYLLDIAKQTGVFDDL